MTEQKSVSLQRFSMLIFSIFLICFSFFNLKEMMRLINCGLLLCVRSVIPSLFPFMIFSEMILYGNLFAIIPQKIKVLFGKLFKVSPVSIGAFLTGILCGFPLGVKYASDLYKSSAVSKDEFERLICFCNNTGPAFVIAGIGTSIRKNTYEGIILYLIQIISAVMWGIIISRKKNTYLKEKEDTFSYINEFSIIECMKKASHNILYICAIVSFFTVLCGYVHKIFSNEILSALFSSFLEIGNGATACAALKNKQLSFILSAGGISFSGMSVHLQAEFFYHDINISKKKYYTSKIMQATLSSIIAFFVSLLTY